MRASPDAPAGLLEAALGYSEADHAEVSYLESREAATRFANNAVTQNVSRRATGIYFRVAFDNRVGSSSTTDLSPAGLRACAAQAEAIARASEPDPEYLPPPGPQSYPKVAGWDARVAEAAPEDRAAGVREGVEIAREEGLEAAGSYSTRFTLAAGINSAGLFHQQALTTAQFVVTAISADSSGWAQAVGHRWEDADPAGCARRAVRKALDARSPREVPAGDYPVILEPAAAADFFGLLADALDARAAHEGRSALTGREGTRIACPGVTLSSRPDHPDLPVPAAGEDGLPLPETTWVRDGVLRSLSYGRFWAGKTGRPFTGKPANLVMAGGDRSLEELIASVERGLLVTRFWYIRFVDPMKLLLTGMTRDGLYWIEDGEVRHGLRNLRFNESPLHCLERITALGPRTRAGRYRPCLLPAMRVEGFRFTSGTAF